MDVGAVLVQARRRSGLTQAEVARRAGTSQPVISAYEHGRRDPTFGTLQRLIAATGGELRVEAAPHRVHDLDPPEDLAEHGRRLVAVLDLADAFPARQRSAVLDAPRLVSR